nr:hypothetical protein CFP56_11898 [Quercus suber]
MLAMNSDFASMLYECVLGNSTPRIVQLVPREEVQPCCSEASLQHVRRPLIRAQEHRAADADPHGAWTQPGEEGPRALLPPHLLRDVQHALPLRRQHEPRLDHVERRRQPRGHRARQRAI